MYTYTYTYNICVYVCTYIYIYTHCPTRITHLCNLYRHTHTHRTHAVHKSAEAANISPQPANRFKSPCETYLRIMSLHVCI